MLPIYLSIEGFYSYQEKQEIDFTALTEGGLFGIFGSVGSGKSSILEAISLALYGDTERLNKTDKRGYNMLNLKSAQAKIVFDFLNFEGKKFRFTAQWRRRPNKFEDTSTIERAAYISEQDRWIPLESADGSLVTNLSYANFRRTIIIPQGQFKEFLELKGKERSEMLKEIFQLNRYDLGPKVSTLQSANNQKLENLKGALSGFEGISAEVLQEKERQLNTNREQLTKSKTELDLLQTQVQILKEAAERHQELADKKRDLDNVLQQKEKIDQLRYELKIYEQTANLFREPMASRQRLEREKEAVGMRVEQLQGQRKTLSEQIDVLQENLRVVELNYKQIERMRQEQIDLQNLIHIRKNETILQQEQANLKKGEPFVEKSKQELAENNELLSKTELKLEDLKSNRFEASELLEIEAWYLGKDNLDNQIESFDLQKKQLQDELTAIRQQFQAKGFKEAGWEEEIKARENLLQETMSQLREQETHLQVQVRLGDFAHSLQDGEACPLCGALEHPQPMSGEQATREMENVLAEKTKHTAQQAAIQQLTTELARLSNTAQHKIENLEKLESDLSTLQTQMTKHKETFRWDLYSPEDKSLFGEQKLKNKKTEEAIQNLESEIKQLRTVSTQKTDEVARFEKRLQTIIEQIAVAKRLIAQYNEQLHTLDEALYKSYSEADLINLKQQTELNIARTIEDYELLTKRVNQKKNEFADIAGQYQLSKEQFGTLRETLAASRAEIAQLLASNQYDDLAQVQQILDKDLPVSQIRSEIQEFDIQQQVLERQVENLTIRTQNDNYTPEKFIETRDRYVAQHSAYEEELAGFGGLERELGHLTVEFAKKERLHEQFEALSKRADHLKIMDNLFRGNGFVNYISTIHMQRLCEIANLRFHRLTKNQLSLSVSDTNDFEVIDNLNNGHHRSVKTLSGGQSFQASLCLALALAENIQSLNKADKNFFFIDEGFGTQDHESINTVFDTLQYLHQENRVVGIISHVEELKERMPRAVTVTKDFERGSIVSHSF